MPWKYTPCGSEWVEDEEEYEQQREEEPTEVEEDSVFAPKPALVPNEAA